MLLCFPQQGLLRCLTAFPYVFRNELLVSAVIINEALYAPWELRLALVSVVDCASRKQRRPAYVCSTELSWYGGDGR
jgi:hypothetical protein